MKNKYVLVGSLAFLYFIGKAQSPESDIKEKVNKTEVEVVYNHYLQDGDNSAITGGTGTEKLTVYGPNLNVKKTWGKSALAINAGADIISSASTDNIDAIMSSASALDTRNHANITYFNQLDENELSAYGGVGFSMESDYLSIATNLGFIKEDKEKGITYTGDIQVFNDDLRWGRLNPDYYRPAKLVYPEELRFKEWYTDYKRNSYNLRLGFSRTINKRTVLGVYPEITYQEGLLATPFHRIYFLDGSLGVEQLPNERYKAALGFKLNKFVGGNTILKNTVSAYVDDFGILGFTLEQETAIKLKHHLVLLPNIRFYNQKGSKYFNTFKKHITTDRYYSSDFDLSTFQTYAAGFGVKFKPYAYLTKKLKLNTSVFRYHFSYRTDGLISHVFSLSFKTEWN